MMRIFISKKISFVHADRLIEKYYDGLTTADEEKQLHKFLEQTNLPEKYYTEQAMFGYFKAKKTSKKKQIPLYVKWAAMIALVFTTTYTIQTISASQLESYAIVNGKTITNTTKIKTIALNSINEISATNSEVEEGLDALNTAKLINEQLDAFSSLAN